MLRLPWLIYKLLKKKDKLIIRGLTTNEVALAKNVYGDLIDYQKVTVINCPYLPWQPSGTFMAPNGCIFVFGKHYKDDYSVENSIYQGIFIHEMAHVLQYQRGVNVFFWGALLQTAYYLSFKRYSPYRYILRKDKPFFAYNVEQQGDIARDIFLKRIPNILLKNKLER
ncbi:MAG: hypothetical protein Q4A84_08750 [Neisseria sp.]|uniref:hypothetical protein n=1 Tax=Neisseria sp. TaxID=192066 RepID=UPI0026DAC771|nr:hypothetical protein [Neisseria sp.]MDO4641765.1 hypothetical protein [Neisseria sp.]